MQVLQQSKMDSYLFLAGYSKGRRSPPSQPDENTVENSAFTVWIKKEVGEERAEKPVFGYMHDGHTTSILIETEGIWKHYNSNGHLLDVTLL